MNCGATFRGRGSRPRSLARAVATALVAGCGALALAQSQESGAGRTAVVLEVSGAIGPATTDYLTRGLDEAAGRGAALVILRMDTPGGLDTSMREIIKAILASEVPVATFVSPSGARAASAGTYILYASHVAAMAPGTNLGAATPVQLGGGGLPFGQDRQDEEQDQRDQGEDGKKDAEGDEQEPARAPRNAMEAKVVNDAVAYIRGLAEMRGRNADWAERAVRQAASLPAREAARESVIDFVARDLDDLAAQTDGRMVQVGGGEVRLALENLSFEVHEPDWRTQLLSVITNPNVALIFMMIGIYGLIFEFINPGALYPGTIGAISLLIGLYSLAVLPITFAGAGLMLLGLALMIAEAFTPSLGVLGIGGAIAFVLGSTVLIDPGTPGFEISLPVILTVAAVSLAFSLLVVRMAWSSHGRAVVSGREQLIGELGEVSDWKRDRGHVLVHGERWSAIAPTALRKGEKVRVTALDGLTLTVESAARETQQGS